MQVNDFDVWMFAIPFLLAFAGLFFNIVLSDCCTVFIIAYMFLFNRDLGVFGTLPIHDLYRLLISLGFVALFIVIFKINPTINKIISVFLSLGWALLAYFQLLAGIDSLDTTWRVAISVVIFAVLLARHISKFEEYTADRDFEYEKMIKKEQKAAKKEAKEFEAVLNKMSQGGELTLNEKLIYENGKQKRIEAERLRKQEAQNSFTSNNFSNEVVDQGVISDYE